MLVDYKYKGDLTYNISNITYPYDYQFYYFFDILLLLVFYVFIFGFSQIYKYSNCIRNYERNENNLEERILSTTREREDSEIFYSNIEDQINNDIHKVDNNELPSYSEINN